MGRRVEIHLPDGRQQPFLFGRRGRHCDCKKRETKTPDDASHIRFRALGLTRSAIDSVKRTNYGIRELLDGQFSFGQNVGGGRRMKNSFDYFRNHAVSPVNSTFFLD